MIYGVTEITEYFVGLKFWRFMWRTNLTKQSTQTYSK